MPEVIMYATATCPYCERARRLLKRKGVGYIEIRVDQDPLRWAEMEARSGRSTVPQIFIGDHHVGGYDDTAALDAQGDLDLLLGLA
ncbi:glutaredoxin 3 [Gammaproteobacteria bacterium]